MTLLAERVGDIQVISGFYDTPAWGYQSAHSFLNIAVQMETTFSPHELLALTQQIERELGRLSNSDDKAYSDRTIDIDIILYDKVILQTPDLILPHPLMHKRLFVLQPLAEIAPDLIHPVLNKTITELYQALLPDI
jgi:2-amino-4-hydroxy-6-hydroxymethyldihydropteridine diphosphokinase